MLSSMSKTLIFSDIHLHNWKYGSNTDIQGMNDRLQNQLVFFGYLIKYCKENNIENIVFCGDLFHTHGKIDVDVLNVAAKGFQGLRNTISGNIYALVGNHDIKRRSSHALTFLKFLGITVIAPRQWWVGDKHPEFGFISYIDNEKDFSDLLTSRLSNPNLKYLFLHQGVKNVKVGSGFEVPNEFLTPDMIPDNIIAFTGHYHRHQKVADNLVVVGSPMQHTWSDAGDPRGFIVLDTDTGKWEHVVYHEAPRFITHKDLQNPLHSSDIANNFIKLVSDKIEKIEHIRHYYNQQGARTVEFSTTTKSFDEYRLEKLQAPLTILEALEVLEKAADKETIETGKKIRQKKYVLH